MYIIGKCNGIHSYCPPCVMKYTCNERWTMNVLFQIILGRWFVVLYASCLLFVCLPASCAFITSYIIILVHRMACYYSVLNYMYIVCAVCLVDLFRCSLFLIFCQFEYQSLLTVLSWAKHRAQCCRLFYIFFLLSFS